jgi:hypothetical protein
MIMKRTYTLSFYLKGILLLLFISLFTSNVNSWGQVSMRLGGSANQDFVALSPVGGMWADNSTISNWYWQQSSGSIDYYGDDGSTNPAITTCYAYGNVDPFGTGVETAMGGVSTGGTGFAMGLQLFNSSGAAVEEIKVSYTGEQWHVGGVKQASKITFWYKISSSPISDLNPESNNGWTAVTSLDFTSPVIFSFGNGKLDGNASANRTVFTNVSIPNLNIPSGNYIMLRWSYPDQGAPHGLAIDDVSVSWIGNTIFGRSGNWDIGRNWNNGLPTSITNAIIDATAVVGNSNINCYNLIINSAKSLTLNSLVQIAMAKNFIIKSSTSGPGSFINNNGTLSISGATNVEMYVQGTTINNGVYFTPPLNNVQASTLSDIVYRYNASTCTWTQVFGTLNVGTGYTIRSDNPVIKTFTGGNLFTTNLFIGGLVRQASPNNYGWNLVGNPYVCGMDWDVLNDTPSNYTNLTNGFYIRASDGATISWVNGVGNPSGTTSIIPPYQGFYAQVLLGQTSGNLNIPLNARVHNNHILYKSAIPVIRLQLTSSKGFSDETVIRIENNATNKLDNEFDGTRMPALNDDLPQIFSLSSDNNELCINAIPVTDGKIVTVPIGFQSKTDGEYSIKAFDFSNLDKSISISLKDNQTNILQDLRKNPVYVFNTNATYDSERFVIILSKQSSEINNQPDASKVLISALNKSIIIDLNGENNATVEVYNILGEQIINKKLNGSSLQKIDIAVNEGIYIVKVYTGKSTIAKKVLLK